MAAVISGNGLGLGNTSLNQLGQLFGGQATTGQGKVNQYLNIANGNLILQNQDEGLIFDGIPLNVLRTYNSQGQLSGSQGWLFGLAQSVGGLTGTVNTAGSTVVRTGDDGSTTTYVYNATLGAYVSSGQSGAQDTLKWNGTSSSWTWTGSASRQQESYNAGGQLTAVSNAETGASFAISYTAGGQISQILAGDGDALIFSYNASSQLVGLSIKEIPPGQTTAVTRQQVGYSYDAQGRLASVTTSLASDTNTAGGSYTTAYTYDGSSDRIASVTQSDGTSVSYSYTEDAQGIYQVTGIVTGTGAAAQAVSISYGTNSTTVTNALGQSWTYGYDAAGDLTQVVAPAVGGGTPTTGYTYDANGDLLQATDANGATTRYSYDANGNLLSVEDGAGNTVSYTYNADDQVLSKTTYTTPAQGVAGQAGYVAPSGAQTTYYVYDSSDRLSYVVDPLGDVTEHDYTTTIAGITVLSSTLTYRGAKLSLTGLTPTTPPTLASLVSWVATTAVKNVLNQVMRTDYTYDLRGQLATQTQWDTVDVHGKGVLDVGTTITTATYDAQGRLLQTATERGSNRATLQTTSYAYDGLGRLIGTTDPFGQVTSYLYTDSQNTLTITQANGQTTSQVRNSAGQLVSSVQWATPQNSLVTSTLFNGAGQAVAVVDPQGHAVFTFYTVDGHVAGTVDASGIVTAYSYDANGNRTQVRQYATPASTAGWIADGALTAALPTDLPVPSAAAADVISDTLYNANGQVVATIDATGVVTAMTYDGLGNVTSTTTYATSLTSQQIADLGTSPTLVALQADLTSAAGDRTQRTVYDTAGHVLATIDADGHVTVLTYDTVGDATSSTVYAIALTSAQLTGLGTAPTLEALQAVLTPGSGDLTSLTIYDASHHVVATIDASGQVATMGYDAVGNLSVTMILATPLTAGQLATLGGTPTLQTLQAALDVNAGARPSQNIYDANHRLIATVDSNGNVTTTTYDAAGNATSTTQYAISLTLEQVRALGDAPTLAALQAELSPGDEDVTNLTVYDAQERVVATVTSDGTVNTTSYDTAGKVTATRQYEIPLSSVQIAALGDTPTLAALLGEVTPYAGDMSTLTIYDASERVVAQVDTNGQVTTTTYDTVGNVATSTVYQYQLSAATKTSLGSNPSLSSLQAVVTQGYNDQVTVTIYDDLGRTVATITPGPSVYYDQYQENPVLTTYDASGNVVAQTSYPALTCQQVEAMGGQPTLAQLQSLLNLRGADGLQLTAYDASGNTVATVIYGQVTLMTYDGSGNQIASTSYGISLTDMQVGSLGTAPTLASIKALIDPNSDYSVDRIVYDANHHVVATVNSFGQVSTTAYDASGNITRTTSFHNALTSSQLDALGISPTMAMLQADLSPSVSDSTTLTIYDVSGRVVATVYPSGLAKTTVYDAAGNIVSATQYGISLTPTQIASLGDSPMLSALQATLNTSTNNITTLTIYDAEGRVVGAVNQYGQVAITSYDPGDVTVSTQYNTYLTAAQIVSLGSTPTLSALQDAVSPTANDRVSVTIHDAAGRVVGQASTFDSTYIYAYDDAGNLVKTTSFYGAMTETQISALESAPTLDGLVAQIDPNARQTYTLNIYDANGHVVASIDADGIVSTTIYDSSGNATSATQYATWLTATQVIALGDTPTMASLQSEITASIYDTTTLAIYDEDNRAVGTVDQYGNVTTTAYDSAGRVTKSTQYITRLTAVQIASLGTQPTMAALMAALGPDATSTTDMTVYDGNGRKVGDVFSVAYPFENDSKVTLTYYDDSGDVTASQDVSVSFDSDQIAALGDTPTLAQLVALLNYTQTDSTFTIYDDSGRPVAVVTGDEVTTTNFNSAGNVTSTAEYYLSTSQAMALADSPTLATLQSIVDPDAYSDATLTIYDDSGNVVGQVDDNGTVTITSYDANGNPSVSTRYSNWLGSDELAELGLSPTLSALEADIEPSDFDQTSITIYDDSGRLVGTVDPYGQVEVMGYDANDNETSNIYYETQLSDAQIASLGSAPTLAQLLATVRSSPQDSVNISVFDSDGDVVATVDGEGNVETRSYDGNGNIVASVEYSGQLSPSQLASLGQSPSLAEVLAVADSLPYVTIFDADGNEIASVDANGTVTTTSFDADGDELAERQYATPLNPAQILALARAPSMAALQALLTPVVIYDASHHVAGEVDIDGDVTTMVYDTSGNVTATIGYVPQLSASEIAELGLDPTLAALQVDLAIAGGAQAAQTIRDGSGRSVATIGADGSVTTTAYDAAGNVTATTQYATPLPADTGYVPTLAALLDLVQSSDADLTTHTIYDAGNHPVATIDASGHVTVMSYDANGVMVSSTVYATTLSRDQIAALGDTPGMGDLEALLSPTTTVIYDGAGQPVATIDPLNHVTYTFYDADGRVAETVDGNGAVTAYAYDADGRLIRTTRYATTVDTTGWLTNGVATMPAAVPVPAASSGDRVSQSIYDAAGQVVATIDAQGDVTTNVYDGAGNVLSTREYATALTATQLTGLGGAPTQAGLLAVLTSTTSDRVTRYFYDADNHQVGLLDASGFLTTTAYDNAGNVTSTVAYAKASPAAARAAGTLAQLLPNGNVYDQTNYYFYDGEGRLVATLDGESYLTTYAYDDTTDQTTQTKYSRQYDDNSGYKLTTLLAFVAGSYAEQQVTTKGADGRVTSRVDTYGNTTSYTYDSMGDLLTTTVTPAAGQGDARTTANEYDAFGDLIGTLDGVASQQLTSGMTASEQAAVFAQYGDTYTYNAVGQVTSHTDPLGNTSWYFYDGDGRLATTIQGQPDRWGDLNVAGEVTRTTYNAFGQVSSTLNYATTLDLTAFQPAASTPAQLAQALAALANPAADVSTTYTYTLDGEVAGKTDGLGYRTVFGYDAFNDLTSAQQQISQPGQGLTAANSVLTQYTYDVRGERVSETDAAGTALSAKSTIAYDAFGRVTETVDSRGVSNDFWYDDVNNVVEQELDYQGGVRDNQATYDAFGRVLTQIDSLGNVTSFQYSQTTNAVTMTTPGGVTSTTVKDAYSSTVSIADANGNATSYTYDADGRLVQSTDALGNTSTNAYDADGNVISTQDATGHQVTYTYDAVGRVLSQVGDPDGLDLETDYTYDGAGRRISVDDPAGTVTTYTYDADSNQVTVVQDAGAGNLNQTTTYTYDGLGNEVTMTVGAGTTAAISTTYVYDVLGRLTQSVVDPTGLAITSSYAYDAAGNRVASTDPDGNTTYAVYNDVGEVIYSITPSGAAGSAKGVLTQYWYDEDGRLLSTHVYSNLVSSTGLGTLATATPTANLNKVAKLVAAATTATDPVTYKVYDADGRLRYSIDAAGAVTEIRYNALGQASETLVYATPLSPVAALQTKLQAGTAVASDLQAALAAAGDTDGTARVSYAYYDADGRVAYTVTPNIIGSTLGAVVTQTQYDAAGRVIASTTYTQPLPMSAAAAGSTTDSIAQALAQTQPTETTCTTQYIYDAAGRQVATVDPNGNTSYTFYDNDGRVGATVDATGAVVAYTRDDLGRVTEQTSYESTVDTSAWIDQGVVMVGLYDVLSDVESGYDRETETTYDGAGRIASITTYSDENNFVATDGDTLTYTYDAASRVVQTTDVDISGQSATRITRYFYDANGNRVGTLDADGYLTTASYDAAGNLVRTQAYATLTNAALRSAGTLAQLIPATTANDKATSQYFDTQGRLVGSLDAAGYFTEYDYDAASRVVSTERYANALSGAATASLATIKAAVAAMPLQQVLNSYDIYGDLISTTNAQGTVTTYTYDDQGRVLQTVFAAGTPGALTTSSTYDAWGNPVTTNDAMGRVTTYTYDMAGNRLTATDFQGNTTWYVYDEDNRQIYAIRGVADGAGVQNALGEVTATEYDAFGDAVDTTVYAQRILAGPNFAPTSGVLEDGFIQTTGPSANDSYGDRVIDYDLEGHAIEDDVNGYYERTEYKYDGFGDMVSKVDAYDAAKNDYIYDAMGNLTQELDGVSNDSSCGCAAAISFEFDSGQAGERTLEWTYDAYGRAVTYTDGNNAVTTYSYDKLDEQTGQSITVQGAPRQTEGTYDAYGRVLSKTDAMGLVTRYAYDDANRTVTVTGPDGLVTTTTTNREGQTVSFTNATGSTTQYTYDDDGHLLQTTNGDGSTIVNQYDSAGNLSQTQDADGHIIAYTYDAAGRILTQTVDPSGANLVTSYAYDGRGLKISVTDPTGVVTAYGYDVAGNLADVEVYANASASQSELSTTYQYNGWGELQSSYARDNLDNSTASQYQEYDKMGRLTEEEPAVGQETNYSYDGDNNIVEKSNGIGDTSYYFYNEADEQVYAITPTGGMDASYPTPSIPGSGAVTQNWYNADGQVVATRQYATSISPDDMGVVYGAASTDLADVSTVVPPGADDRMSYQTYDSAGRPQFSIDASRVVTETRYNAVGQIAETLVYAHAIAVTPSLVASLQAGTATPAQLQAALAAAGDSDATARASFTYYDSMGRVRFTVSTASVGGQSGGLAVETQYDADGNVVAQIQYGGLIPLSALGAGSTTTSVAQVLAGVSSSHATHAIYDGTGRQVYTVDANGFVTETQYDGDGRVSWTLQYAHAISVAGPWTQAAVASAVAAANTGTSDVRGSGNIYDDAGNVIQVLDRLSATPTATYTYNAQGLKTSYTNRDGQTWTYEYDYYTGELIRETSPPVPVAYYAPNGSLIGTVTRPVVTQYEYDNAGHVISQTVDEKPYPQLVTQYVYDTAGNQIQTIYPAPGYIDPTTHAFVATGPQPTSTVTYDAFGEAVVDQDVDGNDSYKAYDTDGRLAYEVDADGYVTGYQYDAYGEQTAATRYATAIDTTALGDTWSDGEPLSVEQIQASLTASPLDRTIATTYDIQGNKLSVTQPAVTYTNSDGSTGTGSPVTTFTYDAYGNVTSQSVLVQGSPAQGNAVWATTYNYYNALGQKTMSVDPMGYATTWTYDAFGDSVGTTEWATPIATSGLVAGGTLPGNPPAGNPATTGADRVTECTYDVDGNKTSESVSRSYVDGTGTPVQGFVTTTYGYDNENRPTTVTIDGQTITTRYDALGRVASVTGPTEKVLVSNWQALMAANPALDLSSPSLYMMASQVMTYTYDAFGNKLVQTQGSTGSSQTVSTYYRYDNANRVIASVTPLAGGAPNWASDQVQLMTYDSSGNLLTTTSTLTGDDGTTVTVVVSNTYDADNQLIGSDTTRSGVATPDTSTATQYDAFGDVVGTGTQVAITATTTYDNAGRAILATDPKTGVVHTYGYNLAGQLVSDTVPLAAGAGTVYTRYTLDLDGRVVAEVVPSTSSAGGENAGILQATYDHWGNVLSSTDAAGGTTSYTYNERNQVVTQTGATVTVVDQHGVSTSTRPVKTSSYDENGNLVAVTDEDGNTTHTLYNAIGQVLRTIDGAGAVSYVGYDALGNDVADQDGAGHVTFKNVDALGRVIQQGDFVLSSTGTSRTITWQQAYVLDRAGNRLVTYDGIGSALLQGGDSTDAALHADYYGYDSQGRVIWSQDADQRAASISNAHGAVTGTWTTGPTNGNFAEGQTGWVPTTGWTAGNFGTGPFGAWSAAFGGTNSNAVNMMNTNRVPVIPGQSITANAWFEVFGPHGGGSVQITWYDANGNFLSSPFDEDTVSAGKGPGRSTMTAVAPPGAAYAAIGINAINYGNPNAVIVTSGVSWSYVPPAGFMSTGPNGLPIVSLPGGSFTQQPANPDFENGDTGWTKGDGWSIPQGFGYNGSGWSAQIDNVGAAGAKSPGSTLVNDNRVPVTPGQGISASAMVQQGASDVGHTGAAVQILWYAADGTLIGTSTGNYVIDGRHGNWHMSSVTGTAPAGAAYAGIAINGWNISSDPLWVDAVQWNYQYIPAAPTGVVEDSVVYDINGNKVSETNADGETETWSYDAYGHVISHTDLSGATYTYTYDAASGQLMNESDNWSAASQGQSLPAYVTGPTNTPNSTTYTYEANGQVASEVDSNGSSYSYAYDANGNQTRAEATTLDGNNNPVHVVTQTTYDSHNRIGNVVETNEIDGSTWLNLTYAYDAAGNRREVVANSDGINVDAWYTYDGDNRVVVSAGSLVNNQIVVSTNPDSYALAYDGAGREIARTTVAASGDTMQQKSYYDARGELIRADYSVDVTRGDTFEGVEEMLYYDANGKVLISDQFYATGTTVGAVTSHKPDPDGDYDTSPGTDVGGDLSSATIDRYDAAGRLLEEQDFGHASGWNGAGGSTAVPPGVPAADATTYGSLTLQTAVVYQGPNGSAGYDAIGDVVSYQYRDGTGRVDQYAVTYIRKDGYLQSTTSGQNISGTPNVRPATDESVYDNRGDLVAIAQHTQYAGGSLADTVRVFAYDGNGEIIERKDGTANGSLINQGSTPAHESQHYVYVEGQQVAHYDEGGTLDVLDEVTAFSNSDSGAGGYVVQAGDTLKSMAQEIYGNASLWYVIADANAISGDSDLAIGQRLTIPEVTTDSNDSTTFKPYNQGSITGSTTPNLPTIAPPPPPPSSSCNALAEIIIIVVVVIVSIYTAGAASELAAGTFEASTAGETFATGASVLSGTAVGATAATTIGAAAVGGFAGSVAGQLTGDALGVSHGFSLTQALTSGLEAGITAGLGTVISGAGDAFFAAGQYTPAGAALYGASAYASQAAAGDITGQPEHFSWAGLVASAVASGLTAEAELPGGALQKAGLASDSFGENLAGGLLSGGLDRETSKLLGDDRVASWDQVGEDAFGNALGNAAIVGINTIAGYQANQLPEIDAPILPVVVASDVQVQVSNIPQAIAPLEYPDLDGDAYDQPVQDAIKAGSSAAMPQVSLSTGPLTVGASTYNNLPVTDLPGPTVTPYDDPNLQPHFYTPEENALFSATSQQAHDDDQMRTDAAAVNRQRNLTAQREHNDLAAADAAVSRDGVTILTAPVVGAIGVAKGLVNTARTALVEGQRVNDYISAKEAQLGTDVFGTTDDQASADQLVQATRAELTQSIDPLFNLNPVEEAGNQGISAVGLVDGTATLIAKAPEIVNGVRGLIETLGDALSGGRAAEAAPEVAMEAAEALPPPNVPVLPDAVDTAMTAAEAEPVAAPVAAAVSESASSIARDGADVFAPDVGSREVIPQGQVSETANSVASSESTIASVSDVGNVAPEVAPDVEESSEVGGLERDDRSAKVSVSPLSQPGGLAATEGNQVVRADGSLSKPTHPLTKHGPEATDQYVYDRVNNELSGRDRTGLRTAFNDRAQMESAISETFKMKQAEIDDWLASGPRAGVPKAFEANPGMGNLGRGYQVTTKGGPIVPISHSMPNVNLVLMPDGVGGYLIHTAHPF
jgi:YD repeat-containing protein